MKEKPKSKRNKRIVEDYEKGEPVRFIASMYGISHERVYIILDEMGAKKRHKVDKSK